MNESQRTNRRLLLTIAGIPLVIILAASVLWYLVASGRVDLVALLGTANRGDLLDPPLNASALKLADGDEEVFDPDPEKPLWRILVPGGSSCEDDCRQVLHYTRQIHTAMGKYQNRIERLMVLSSQPAESALSGLQAEYPSLKVLYTPRAGMEALTSTQAGSASAAYFLVDPQGWVILSYPGDADGKDIMADLKFLLKNSNG